MLNTMMNDTKALGELLVETAAAFQNLSTTTTANPSEADVDGEGE